MRCWPAHAEECKSRCAGCGQGWGWGVGVGVGVGAHHDDALQELPGFVDGGVGIKAGAAGGKLVVQDSLQLLRQAVGLLLQLGLLLLSGQGILLQLLVVPAPRPIPSPCQGLSLSKKQRGRLCQGL